MFHLISKSFFSMLLFASAAALVQTGCGEKSESSKVDFKPDKNPIIVKADLTIPQDDGDKTIKAPWYRYRYSIRNGSKDQTLYLVTFTMQVAVTDSTGTKTGTIDLDPGEFCEDDYTRPFLGIIPPGETFTGNDMSVDNGCALPGGTPTRLTTGFEDWYLYGLPESESNTYTIQIQGEGWFENANGEVTERLYVYGFQITR